MLSLAKNFLIPNMFEKKQIGSRLLVGVIIPSYKPTRVLFDLVSAIATYGDVIDICVVDDSTPKKYTASLRVFEKISVLSPHITVLRTTQNKMKAGAINLGLDYFTKKKGEDKPDAIFILDDDVLIAKDTIGVMLESLFSDDRIGVVCSQARVLNKNTNILTRLQGLEYQGFNALRVADEGFLLGPLVMHGMLSAFRTKAIEDVGYFAEGHLIEDYEITARLKLKGWHVRMAKDAYAWTNVPETFADLWKQRARWTYGGMLIVTDTQYLRAVPQDIIGHTLFLSTLTLIIASFLFPHEPGSASSEIIYAIIIISIMQALISYVFNMWYMKTYYEEKDIRDWLLRASLIPEFLYANLLSIILLVAYIYFIIDATILRHQTKNKFFSTIIYAFKNIFLRLGYSGGWGTRQS